MHDGLATLPVAGIKGYFDALPASVVGLADPAALLHWRQLTGIYPAAKWVVVRRNETDALASSVKAFGLFDAKCINLLSRQMYALIANLEPLQVSFDAINPAAAYKVADYLGVDIGPAHRVEQLCHLNVQIDPGYLAAGLKQIRAQNSILTT